MATDIELLKMAVRFPDALNTVREEIDETEWQQLKMKLIKLLNHINDYRLDEGKVLETDFKNRITNYRRFIRTSYCYGS